MHGTFGNPDGRHFKSVRYLNKFRRYLVPSVTLVYVSFFVELQVNHVNTLFFCQRTSRNGNCISIGDDCR